MQAVPTSYSSSISDDELFDLLRLWVRGVTKPELIDEALHQFLIHPLLQPRVERLLAMYQHRTEAALLQAQLDTDRVRILSAQRRLKSIQARKIELMPPKPFPTIRRSEIVLLHQEALALAAEAISLNFTLSKTHPLGSATREICLVLAARLREHRLHLQKLQADV
jgi:hypothetical protein